MARLRLEKRGLGAALAVGVAVGFAQAIPLMLLPVVFEYPLRYGTLFAILAIAPFAVALFAGRPVVRPAHPTVRSPRDDDRRHAVPGACQPRRRRCPGCIAAEVRTRFAADPVGASLSLDPSHYLLFILPLVLIGGGFVIATTVRTAIVFASTPRGLPASAAAINEASVGLGSRLGIVIATTALTMTALGSARDMVVGRPDRETLIDEFRVALISLGTPRFKEVYQASIEGAEPIKRAAYGVAYMDGVVTALIISGLVGVIGALLAWVLIGRQRPAAHRLRHAGRACPG